MKIKPGKVYVDVDQRKVSHEKNIKVINERIINRNRPSFNFIIIFLIPFSEAITRKGMQKL